MKHPRDSSRSRMSRSTLERALGGRAGVSRLVRRFFEQMERRPSASGIRSMHAADLEPIGQKLTAFLHDYVRTPGRGSLCSILPLAHFRFSIGQHERDEWLHCMREALREVHADEGTADTLMRELTVLADLCRSDGDC